MTKISKIVLVTFLTFTAINSLAQSTAIDSTQRNFYYEQGINCTQFVKQFLSFNENFATNMPYLLTGNIGYKNIGLRYGTNYQISNSKNNTEGSSSSNTGTPTITPPSVDELSSITIYNRLGIYFRKIYFKRLNLNFGLDFLISNSFVKTKTESSQIGISGTTLTKADTKTSTKSMGYGPFMTINYNVWKNISLGTEAALYYLSGSSKIVASSYVSNSPNSPFGTFTYLSQESSGKTAFGGTEIRIPLTLYVYFKF